MNEKFVYTEEVTGEIVHIPVELLHHHHDNPRKDLGDLTELTDSIKAKGVLQNLTVVPFWFKTSGVGEDRPEKQAELGYLVVIGNRRLEAAKAAGLETMPCIIAKMTHAEQVQTMLLENMQRTDLTIYEQAQGFQMMIDFGDSIDTVAEKTGFSKTTIRRRLKMAELDPEILKKASSRQVSLLDYDKLSQIESVEKRNEVLKEIGTANFERAVKNAVEGQKREKLHDEWRKVLLEKGLAEIDYSETFSGKYHSTEKSYCLMNTISASEYILAGDEEYFSFSYNTVYFRRNANEQDEQRAAEKARNEAAARERREKLDDATRRAFELRRDYVFGISDAKAKKNLATIIEYDIRRDWEASAQGGYYMRYIHENFAEQSLGTRDGYHTISDEVQNAPYRSFLRHVYVRWADSKDLGYFRYDEKWVNNERLSLIYDFLIKLGYEMSDEEKALQDGTHELFCCEEESAGTDDIDDDEEYYDGEYDDEFDEDDEEEGDER